MTYFQSGGRIRYLTTPSLYPWNQTYAKNAVCCCIFNWIDQKIGIEVCLYILHALFFLLHKIWCVYYVKTGLITSFQTDRIKNIATSWIFVQVWFHEDSE